jgi:uncharacterized membrane protein
MNIFKKMLTSIAIIILVNCSIYIYPMYKVISIYTTEQNNITISAETNPNYGRLNKILKSDAADEYKRDAILTFSENRTIRDNQRNEFYKILVYFAAIISIITFIIGFVIKKKSETNKYIGTAFILSSIVSILLLILLSYSIYMGM